MHLLGCDPGLHQHTAGYPVSKFKFNPAHRIYCSRRIFKSCVVSSKNEFSIYQSQAKVFINKFKSLECISTDNSNLQTINSFYDHSYEMFTIFCNDQCFCQKSCTMMTFKIINVFWIENSTIYWRFCTQLTEFQDISTTRKASTILLGCLFSTEEKYVWTPPLRIIFTASI